MRPEHAEPRWTLPFPFAITHPNATRSRQDALPFTDAHLCGGLLTRLVQFAAATDGTVPHPFRYPRCGSKTFRVTRTLPTAFRPPPWTPPQHFGTTLQPLRLPDCLQPLLVPARTPPATITGLPLPRTPVPRTDVYGPLPQTFTGCGWIP